MTDLLKKYGGAVPRYTSYPTAPHFSDAVTADIYDSWLADLPQDQKLSLYFHIPFCDTLCWFCGCHTKVTRKYEPVAAYFTTMLQELDLIAAKLGPNRLLDHIHLGGGSPTILQADDFSALADRLRQHFTFTEEYVFSVEIDPRGVEDAMIDNLAAAGVNRASLGVQDNDPVVQKAINRLQPFDETATLVHRLRARGIDQINMDLMYGLPHQSMERLLTTIDQVATLRPTRLALFGYAHVPWMKTHQKMIDEAALPGPEERFAQSERAAERLESLGYQRIGLDHFALPDDPMAIAAREGKLHRNFQGYTTDTSEALIPVGASSIGSLPQGYLQNNPSLPSYKKAIEAGQLPIVKGVALSEEDKMRAAIIRQLMCYFEADLADFAEDGPNKVTDLVMDTELLRHLQVDDMVTVKGSKISLTETGRPFLRVVCSLFDSYFRPAQGRHSAAI